MFLYGFIFFCGANAALYYYNGMYPHAELQKHLHKLHKYHVDDLYRLHE